MDERTLESTDLLDIYCYLACMGPEAFSRSNCAQHLGLLRAHSARAAEAILDETARQETSRRLAGLLAERLSRVGSGRAVGPLLAALVDSDVEAGFTVLKELAAAAPAPIATDLSDVLLSLLIAEGRACPAAESRRVVYLLSVLAELALSSEGRARAFLALTQNLQDRNALYMLLPSRLYPARPEEGATVLTDGNDDAVEAVLLGATVRPRGKAEFHETCKFVMAQGAGLSVLGRVHRILTRRLKPQDARSLSATVRAVVLGWLEGTRRVIAHLPEEADTWTLNLLAMVVSGLKEPSRSLACEYVLKGASALLKSNALSGGNAILEDDALAFVQAVVTAAAVHSTPEVASAMARRMVMDAAAAMHVRAPDHKAARAFGKMVLSMQSEFRRRAPLSSALTPVMPFLTAFVPDQAQANGSDVWTDALDLAANG